MVLNRGALGKYDVIISYEKKKKAWHVTTALHNSRYSQRMFDNHVRPGAVIPLEEKDEILITGVVADIVKEDNLNVIEYNMCGDHMHLLIVCEKEELSKIVGKIKAKSGRKYNIENGINKGTCPLVLGERPLVLGERPLVREEYPLEKLPSKNIENNTGKKKYNSLWTQKFGKSEIRDERYLNNAIAYIRDNRIKHHLSRSERIEEIKKEFLCTKEQAFRTEY